MPDNHAKPSKPDDGGRIVPLVPLPGFVDVYGLGARKENYEIARILSLFESWGYIPLKMPIIEHASCFSEAITGHSPWPEWSSESIFSVDLPSYGMNYDDKRGVEPGLLIPEGTISVTRWLAHPDSVTRNAKHGQPFPNQQESLEVGTLRPCPHYLHS